MEPNIKAWTRQTVRILEKPRYFNDEGSPVGGFRSVVIDSQDNCEFLHQVDGALDILDPDQTTIRPWPHGPRRLAFGVRRRNIDPEKAIISDYGLPVIVWGVREDEALYAHLSHIPQSPGTMGDLWRATRDEYTEYDWTDVLVWETDGGRGGDQMEYDLVSFLLDHGVDLGIGASTWAGARLTKFLFKIRRTRKADRLARLAVRRWGNRGFDSPWMIRIWFETKEQWKLREVSKRLQISEMTAAEILQALGYERISERPELWILSEKPAAKRKRQKWMKSETTAGLNEILY